MMPNNKFSNHAFIIADDKIEDFLKETKESKAFEKCMERAKRNNVDRIKRKEKGGRIMEQREKLIDLIVESTNKGMSRHLAKIIADYLIANGVIVLPCNVGDAVYSISNKICKEKTRHRNTCYDCDGTEFWNNCFRANDAPFSVEFEYDMIDEIDKTVFLTKEEAERALEKQKGGDE